MKQALRPWTNMIEFHGMRLADSETARLLVTTDWSASALGPAECWPAAVKTAIQLCLNSPFPMTLMWDESSIAVYNDGYIAIMGGKHPRGFGRPVGEVYPELVDVLGPVAQAVLSGGEAFLDEHRLLPLDRRGRPEEAYFKFSYSPVHDEMGQGLAVLCIAEETTRTVLQQRRGTTLARMAEELSKRSSMDPMVPAIEQATRSNPLDFARVALLAVDAGSQVTLRWSEPEAYGSSLLEAPEVIRRLQNADRSQSRNWLEPLPGHGFGMFMVDDDLLRGTVYLLAVEPDPLVTTDRDYRGLLQVVQETLVGAVYRIFTEREALFEMSRQLDERERLYRLLFEHSGDGVLITTLDGDIQAANPAACAMLGYSEDEIRRLGRQGLVVESEDGSLARALAVRQETGRFMGELTYRRKDGTTMVVDVSSAVFQDETVAEARSIILFRDAEPRLVTQERVAATARLEAVGALTGGIAHDFNNLLNVIINGAEDVMERLPAADPARRSAELVLTASVKAADLTRQLLAFSRQQPMAVRNFDMATTLRELDQIIGRTMGGGIDVRLECADAVTARADPSLLQNAILNLCINARDAMDQGGTLTIGARAVPLDGDEAEAADLPPGRYVEVSVADTGTGIAPEHLRRIVEPFYTTKPAGKGTGLGVWAAERNDSRCLRLAGRC